MAIIYAAQNKTNNKMYIGKSINDLSIRKRKHFESALSKNKSKTYFHKALLRYGKDMFDWLILEETTNDLLNKAEKYWIAYYRNIGAKLYNLTNGGDGLLGYSHTDLTKNKIAATLRGIKHTKTRNDNVAKSLSKTYVFLDSNKNKVIITNLREFCRANGYDAGSMLKVFKGKRKSAYGYTQYTIEKETTCQK